MPPQWGTQGHLHCTVGKLKGANDDDATFDTLSSPTAVKLTTTEASQRTFSLHL
eukprot:SAG31_NODE_33684_length_341_cov_0.644628_1_plen_53_part_01